MNPAANANHYHRPLEPPMDIATQEPFSAADSDIIGESRALTEPLRQSQMVASTGSTILIQGETGTGKERFAEMIHRLSPRRNQPFVKVNCAAIPLGLLESELFGHERGAFTGAIAQRIGRFERAHQRTLLLDEVGDIPSELQPKLLRVLQEREFERLGSTHTIHSDVRSLLRCLEAIACTEPATTGTRRHIDRVRYGESDVSASDHRDALQGLASHHSDLPQGVV